MSEEKNTFRVQAFYKSDKARRPNNEDFVALWEPEDFAEREKNGCIYVVADGVGGASVGERASKYAAEKVVFEFTHQSETAPGERLRKAMKQANREIFEYAEDNDMRMATTLVAAVIRGNQLHVANVGDSRAYLIRGTEVTQLTRDHSLVGERVRDGSMTEAEAQASKIKNRLTRSIGGEPDVSVDVFDPVMLKPGDKLLLCSDGLTRYALKEDLAEMTARGTAEEIAERLVAFAKKRGGADNVSALVALYEPSMVIEPTMHVERPVEVTWENITTQPVMPKYPGFQRRSRLPASVYVSLGIAATLIIVAVGVLGIGLYRGYFATGTSLPTQAPVVTLTHTQAPTPLTTVTLAPMMDTKPIVTEIPATATRVFLVGKIICIAKIRFAPSTASDDNYPRLPDGNPFTIPLEETVNIKAYTYNDSDQVKEWYLIWYAYPVITDLREWWITKDCVDVSNIVFELIPKIQPPVSTPTSTITPTITDTPTGSPVLPNQ